MKKFKSRSGSIRKKNMSIKKNTFSRTRKHFALSQKPEADTATN